MISIRLKYVHVGQLVSLQFQLVSLQFPEWAITIVLDKKGIINISLRLAQAMDSTTNAYIWKQSMTGFIQ